MKFVSNYLSHTVMFFSLLFLVACSQGEQEPEKTSSIALLNVYKSQSCKCCQKWIRHIEDAGFATKIYHPTDLYSIKSDYKIQPKYRSCHTAVTSDGYVFEGHIPGRFIQQFLQNPPEDAIGLSVPGMPVGSPGMEVGQKFMPYKVLLLKKDGSAEIFTSIISQEQQKVKSQ